MHAARKVCVCAWAGGGAGACAAGGTRVSPAVPPPGPAVPQMLVVFKSAPILKRALKVKQAMMQLYVLKLLKVQTKYLGRQWRKSNMKTMSAIYQKVRHRLNDDWAYGNGTSAAAATVSCYPQSFRPMQRCVCARAVPLLLRAFIALRSGLWGRIWGDGIVGQELAAASAGSVGGCLLCAHAYCSL